MADWHSRITETSEEDPRSLKLHPDNWRLHDSQQRDRFRRLVAEVGFVRRVIVSANTRRVLNGNMRVSIAVEDGQPTVPVAWVIVSEEEEAEILATFDPLSEMARTDRAAYDALLDETPFAAMIWERDPVREMLPPASPPGAVRGTVTHNPRNRAFYVHIPRAMDVDAVRAEIVEFASSLSESGVEAGRA